MVRPLSWLPQLAIIRQKVADSARSQWVRQDLERLFELQPQAAQKLIEQMGSVPIGTSRLVDLDVLLAFLEAVRDAGDPRSCRLAPNLVLGAASASSFPTILPPASWETLPEALSLAPGELRVTFSRVEELAAALAALASLLDQDLEACRSLQDPPRTRARGRTPGYRGHVRRAQSDGSKAFSQVTLQRSFSRGKP